MPSPEKSMEPAPERPRLCTREKPDVAVIRSRGKSKWQRSAALRSPLASAVGAQRSPASACRAFARAASGKPRGSTQVLWRSARLRLVERCRVQTRSDFRAIYCLAAAHAPVHTHHPFTTLSSSPQLNTVPSHSSSAQSLTHHSLRHSSPSGAAPPWSVRWGCPGSLLASGASLKSRPRAPSPQRFHNEITHRVIPFRSASRCACVGSRLWPGAQSVCAGGYAGAAWSPPCQRQARVQAEEVWG